MYKRQGGSVGDGTTVIVAVAECEPAVAVMVAVPVATPITRPDDDTVATPVLLLVHVTPAPAGVVVADKFTALPTTTLAVDGDTDTPVTDVLPTVTVIDAVVFPKAAVIVQVPGATEVT